MSVTITLSMKMRMKISQTRSGVIKMIYLDNAATTKIHPDVLSEMMPYLTDEYGNAGTKYSIGIKAYNAVSKARRQVAEFIQASPDQIIFTSSGSEANNLALNGTLKYIAKKGKTRVLVSGVEHDSVLRAVEAINKRNDFSVGYIHVNKEGKIDVPELMNQLSRKDVGLVSVMYENNETGAVNPISQVGLLCKRYKTLFHTDCVQAAGWLPIDVDEINCDFLSISSHKIHGCKGVGALYVRNKKILTPQILGGANQEFGYRAGTENVAGIVGFGKACELAKDRLQDMSREYNLKWVFWNKLVEEANKFGIKELIHLNAIPVDERSKTISIRFDGVDSETLLLLLDVYGICVSAGSACKSHETKPSKVLLEIMSEEEARSTIRVSFSTMNTEEEVLEAAETLAGCVSLLVNNVI